MPKGKKKKYTKAGAGGVSAKEYEELKKKRKFKTFYYRGVEVEKLLDLSHTELSNLFHARARRKFRRGIGEKPQTFMNRLRKARKSVVGTMKKPKIIKTHLRNLIIVPEMMGSIVGVYNGKGFIQVDIKADMLGYYLGEFSITYKPVGHGRPGVGSTGSSRFIPLK